MLKIKLHKNLLYLLALFILNLLRNIATSILLLYFQKQLILLLNNLMSIGKIIGGLIIYIYQIMTWRKKQEVKYFRIKLIYNIFIKNKK